VLTSLTIYDSHSIHPNNFLGPALGSFTQLEVLHYNKSENNIDMTLWIPERALTYSKTIKELQLTRSKPSVFGDLFLDLATYCLDIHSLQICLYSLSAGYYTRLVVDHVIARCGVDCKVSRLIISLTLVITSPPFWRRLPCTVHSCIPLCSLLVPSWMRMCWPCCKGCPCWRKCGCEIV